MNFLGHIVIALDVREDPRFLLGAILPDLARMAGGRVTAVADPSVAEGVRHHHVADAAFHSARSFLRLTAGAFRVMQEAGMARPQARGAAHVAVELLLDGVLADREPVGGAYMSALTAGAPAGAGGDIAWRAAEQAHRFEALRGRLTAHGVPRDYAEPDVVCRRIVHTLSPRPALRLTDEDARLLGPILIDLDRSVRAHAEPMLGETRAAIRRRSR